VDNFCQCGKLSQPPSGASGGMFLIRWPTTSSGATICRSRLRRHYI